MSNQLNFVEDGKPTRTKLGDFLRMELGHGFPRLFLIRDGQVLRNVFGSEFADLRVRPEILPISRRCQLFVGADGHDLVRIPSEEHLVFEVLSPTGYLSFCYTTHYLPITNY